MFRWLVRDVRSVSDVFKELDNCVVGYTVIWLPNRQVVIRLERYLVNDRILSIRGLEFDKKDKRYSYFALKGNLGEE